jgi:autotransporter-associated beta strand protein/T5SS/PEP-CTERM-associated repeat protein
MRWVCLYAAIAVTLSAGRASAQLPAGNWGLLFADEFTGQGGSAGTNLDPVKWNTAYPWGRTHNYPAYIRDENITVSGGTLNLQAKRESYGGQPFTSGAINSNGKLNFHLGYVEARLKLPGWLGAWPAFWALQDGWPPELDVMEARYRSSYSNGKYDGYGDMYSYIGTYHWGADYTQEKSAGTGFVYPGGNLTSDFHNYGTMWAADHVTFYFDGRDMGSVWSSSANIAQMQNMYLLLNLGVGGWPGDPPSWESLAAPYQADWVRVWQRTGTTQSTWKKVGSGNQNWDDAGNWTGDVPRLSTQTAFFGSAATGATHIDWAGNKTIGQLTLQSATDYEIGWADDSLMMSNPGGRAYINGYNQSGQGHMSISSRIELYSDTSIRNYLANPITLNGLIIGTGELSTENGRVVINGPATYTGATRVQNGGNLTLNNAVSATSNLFVNSGSATIVTTGALTSSNYSSIGQNAGDNATLTVAGNGQLTVPADLNIADVGATGVLNIGGAAQVKARTLYVGKFGAANGTVNQTGGAVSSVAGAGDWRIGGGGSASDAAAIGKYNLQGGTLSTASNLQVGAFGTGTLTQTAGAATVGGFLSIGRYTGGTGTYNITAGSLTASAQPYLVVGEQGTGTLLVGGGSTVNAATLSLGHSGGTGTVTQTGGTVNASVGVAMGLNASGGKGTYTLGGGVLNTPKVYRGAGGGVFNFNGGTLRASAASATFMQGLSSGNVEAGGARIDTNGFDITIAQPLAGSGGLTKSGAGNLALTGVNSYTGGTAVQGGALSVNAALAEGVTVAAGAHLGGSGSIQGALDLSGDLSPGNSPGTLTAASARFRSGATYTVELAGAGYYDHTKLSGAATFDPGGSLNVLLPGGYLPGGGESFDILTYGSEVGRFSSYSGLDLSNGLVLAPFYTDNALRLVATVHGDADGDGQVTFADFQRLELGLGKAGGWENGDFNLDGTVDSADYQLLYQDFGRSVRVAAPLAAQSVPEPASLLLLGAAGLLLGRWRGGGRCCRVSPRAVPNGRAPQKGTPIERAS